MPIFYISQLIFATHVGEVKDWNVGLVWLLLQRFSQILIHLNPQVWNVSSASAVKKQEILTTGSVSTVKWRPGHREQLATGYMTMMDFNINLWDLRRRYVPYAQFQVG